MTSEKEIRRFLVSEKLKKLNIVFGAFLLCISLWVAFPLTARAEGEDNPTTEVTSPDDLTRDPSESANKDKRTVIYSGCKFNPENNTYYYAVDGITGDALTSSILSETMTNGYVWVNAAVGLQFTVYKDGQEYTEYKDGSFSEPGEYAISVYDNNGRKEVPLRFTILGKTGNQRRFDFPSTCRVETILRDGGEMVLTGSSVDLSVEGEYEITYRVIASKKANTIKIRIDNTAPTISFTGLNSKNQASGPVEIKAPEENCSISVYLNGRKIAEDKKLVNAGNYRVVVQDEAKNQSMYEFVILPYFNVSSWIVLAICILAVIGAIVYVVFVRKNLRVR